MGAQVSSPEQNEAKTQMVETSSGTHFFEVHMPTLGFGTFTVIAVAVALIAAYLCLRPKYQRRRGKPHMEDVEAGPTGHLSILPSMGGSRYPIFRSPPSRFTNGWDGYSTPGRFTELEDISHRERPLPLPSRALTPGRTRRGPIAEDRKAKVEAELEKLRNNEAPASGSA